MTKISILTLGCKVNKYESDCLLRMLEDIGFSVSEELIFADNYIINSCAVTNEAEKKSRQYISKINKINPNAKILFCGCASEKNNESLLQKKNVIKVFVNQRKDEIVKFLQDLEYKDELLSTYNENISNPKISNTRAYLKIQDGCNRFCSYCIIPYVRGRSVSRDLSKVITEAEVLDKFYKEIVIVGIDMSDYKIDGKLALDVLINNLSHINARIRLGSLEVSVINEEFLKSLLKLKNFCPQFHLSLQSGDDFVLKKMNRKYTSKEYLEACNLIYKFFPDANITTDIIVGFPYEDEENFKNTLNLVREVKFGKIHCFPFSAKKGTLAYTYKDIDKNIKKERLKILSNLGEKLATEYHSKFINRNLIVLVEEIEDNYIVGYSENYIKCYMENDTKKYKLGEIITVKGIKIYKEGLKVK